MPPMRIIVFILFACWAFPVAAAHKPVQKKKTTSTSSGTTSKISSESSGGTLVLENGGFNQTLSATQINTALTISPTSFESGNLSSGTINMSPHLQEYTYAGDLQGMLSVLKPGLGSTESLQTNNSAIIYGGNINSNGITPNADLQALIENLENGGSSTVVPEPATIALAALGLTALLLMKRSAAGVASR